MTLRHTAKGLGSGLTLAIGSSVMGLSTENRLFGFATQLTSTRFSRKMETDADSEALNAVNRMYGHVNGADALFQLFMLQRDDDSGGKLEQFLSTHPLDEQRINRIDKQAMTSEWQMEGDVTPLPVSYNDWLD